MSEFRVVLLPLKERASEINRISSIFKSKASQIARTDLALSDKNYTIIKNHLSRIGRELEEEASKCGFFGSSLTEIIKLYTDTENRLCNNGESTGGQSTTDGEKRSWAERLRDDIVDSVKRLADVREVEPFEIDSIVFGRDGEYGGDQGSPKNLSQAEKQRLYEIIRENYPGVELSDQQLNRYLSKMNSEGCGYMALVNTIFMHYEHDPQGFERTFGYPMYDKKGNLNFEMMFADFHSSVDNRDADGGINYGRDYDETEDGSWSNYDYWSDLTGSGINPREQGNSLETFIKNHGGDVKVKTNVDVDIYNFDNHIEDGEQVIVEFYNGNLYNMDGSVKQVITSHAMVVTGVTADGKFIVSSWGDKCYIDPYEIVEVKGEDGRKRKTTMSFTTVKYK